MEKLPIGRQDFKTLIEDGCTYIDKTELIYELLTSSKHYFLSRPRRFGKSLLVSTLKEIFLGSQELFKGLWIEDKWDWSQQSPIIFLPFSQMGYRSLGLKDAFIQELHRIAKSYQINLHHENQIDLLFRELITKLHDKHGKVVILVDEYDKPIIDYLGNDIELAKKNQQIMKTFYSILKDADGLLRFVFITGVSKFSKVSIFSDLNNLNDITLKKQYGCLLGYTQEEIIKYFPKRLAQLALDQEMSQEEVLEAMKLWYNGYNWKGKEKMYNPFGILNLLDGLEFSNYWFETATPTFLIELLKNKELYDFDNIRVDQIAFESFGIDEDFDPVSLMFQTGYLTIKSYDKETELFTLGYPNKEVRNAFVGHLLGTFSGIYSSESRREIVKFKEAFEQNDLDKVKLYTEVMLKNIPYQLHEQTERFYHAILHLTYYFLGLYIQSEVCTSDGRADAIVKTATHIYCFEFKFEKTAEDAMQQIEAKNYLLKYANEGKKLIGVGVNFSSEKKGINGWIVKNL